MRWTEDESCVPSGREECFVGRLLKLCPKKEEAIRLPTIQIVIKAKRMMCIVQSTLMSGLMWECLLNEERIYSYSEETDLSLYSCHLPIQLKIKCRPPGMDME